jgi:hypothetical protein
MESNVLSIKPYNIGASDNLGFSYLVPDLKVFSRISFIGLWKLSALEASF